MKSNIIFMPNGWDDYQYWQTQDRKTLRRINQLIQDIDRNGHEGMGKPEPLRHELQGWWSRSIDEYNRLVYRVENNQIIISSCRLHYE